MHVSALSENTKPIGPAQQIALVFNLVEQFTLMTANALMLRWRMMQGVAAIDVTAREKIPSTQFSSVDMKFEYTQRVCPVS